MMTKQEIISNALDQLIEKFQTTPESFQISQVDVLSCVMWSTQIHANQKLISDPTSYSRTVMISFSSLDNAIVLTIYNDVYPSITFLDGKRADARVESRRPLEQYRGLVRKYKKLINMIQKSKDEAETKDLMNKLAGVFPTMLDHFLLGK